MASWLTLHGPFSAGAETELAIRDAITIPVPVMSGDPVLVILRTWVADSANPAEMLPARLELAIEQNGRVLAKTRTQDVRLANHAIGEIRHQFNAGPPGMYQVHARLDCDGRLAESLSFLYVADNQAEADAYSRRLKAVCDGLEGGYTSIVDPFTGEAECQCAHGMWPNRAGNRCESWP